MKNNLTKTNLKVLYKKKLKPRLIAMEAQKKIVRRNLILLAIVLIISTFYLIYKYRADNPEIVGIFIFLSLVVYGFTAKKITKKFKRKFKQTIIKEMFSLLIDKCHFDQSKRISRSCFDDSHLFTDYYNRFYGEDYASGLIGETKVYFSELRVQHVTGSGKSRHVTTRFRGLFFKCTFKKHLKTPIIIHTDVAENVFGRNIGRFFQKRAKRGFDLVQLESPEFEKHFAVYTKDQVQARVILNPKTMQQLTSFIKKHKERIEISLKENKLYFAVHTSKNHFEPALFSTTLKWRDIIEIYEILNIMTELIDQLNIDERVKS